MSDALTFILTNQGLQALINAEADGTQEILLSHVGFGDSRYTPDASMTALKHEITRVSAVSGANVGDHIIHITASDDSNKSYNIYEAGIYATVTGEDEPILFAIYSRPDGDPIIQKSSLSRAYLAFDLLISSSAIDQITFGDTNFLNPPATTTTMGVAELATEEEVELGTAGNKIVTPATLLSALSAANSQLFKSLCAALKANSSVMLPVASRTVLGGVKVDGLKGVKIGADGMLSVDFSSMPDDQLEEVVLAMVQEGGGISVDGEGKLYVDFESMPTDKFEAMLKSIKVPIWLTKNTNFYVNITTGSDVLDEGRGLSADKPFKSPTACLKYVCDTYNLSSYRVTIHLAPGTYPSTSTENTSPKWDLGDYTASSGDIVIQGDNSNAPEEVILNYQISSTSPAYYTLKDLTIATTIKASNGPGYSMVALEKGTLNLQNIVIDLINVEPNESYARNCLNAENDGFYRIYATNSLKVPSGLSFNFRNKEIKVFPIRLVKSRLLMTADINILGSLIGLSSFISASEVATMSISLSVFVNPGRKPRFNYSEEVSVTGVRYRVSSNSILSTGGEGPDFIPGSKAGSVSSGGQYL